MSPVPELVGLLSAIIVLYVAIALLVHTTGPGKLSSVQEPTSRRNKHNGVALALRPLASAIACVRDTNGQDWTWQQFTVVTLLLTVLSLAALALVGVGIVVWTLL